MVVAGGLAAVRPARPRGAAADRPGADALLPGLYTGARSSRCLALRWLRPTGLERWPAAPRLRRRATRCRHGGRRSLLARRRGRDGEAIVVLLRSASELERLRSRGWAWRPVHVDRTALSRRRAAQRANVNCGLGGRVFRRAFSRLSSSGRRDPLGGHPTKPSITADAGAPLPTRRSDVSATWRARRPKDRKRLA